MEASFILRLKLSTISKHEAPLDVANIYLFAVSTTFPLLFLFSSLFKAIISQAGGLIQILSQ